MEVEHSDENESWTRHRVIADRNRRHACAIAFRSGHGREFPPCRVGPLHGKTVKEVGLGKLLHVRSPTEIDKQMVIRMNRDTLYSSAVFDLDAGPVTITLPDAGKRFMSMQIIDEDHYAPMVAYSPNSVTLSKDKIGSRYVLAAVRTLVDPSDPKDVEAVHTLQDSIKVVQPGGPGAFEIPNWDGAS